MKKIWLALPLLVACTENTENEIVQHEPLVLAFGSCNNQNNPSPVLEAIADNNPDAFIWLGDNVYADSDNSDTIREAYRLLDANPDFQDFQNRDIPMYATWDDHDYGQNDAGKEWEVGEESKIHFLNFFGVPENDDRWKHGGVYSSQSFGKSNEVKLILLDTRTFRDALVKDSITEGKLYTENPDGDILGDEQWRWLEGELQDTSAELIIIGSSIQLLANDHGWEKWGNFPKAKRRMLETLTNANTKNIVVISGDRHFAEISKTQWNGRFLYDITSSNLNFPSSPPADENKLRVGEVISDVNFGLLKIEWKDGVPHVKVELRGLDNVQHSEQEVIWE